MKSDRAIARYLQIASIEQTLGLCEISIGERQKEIQALEDELAELQKTKRELLKDMRAAAKDEGQLPLFDDIPALLDRAPRVGTSLHA